MKVVILVLSPKECCNLFNGDLSVLVRKRFPKDYVGWVYIYVTKDKKIFLRDFRDKKKWAAYWKFVAMGNDPSNVGELPPILNGKVVARFWCDKVEGAYNFYVEELCQLACINKEELYKYAGGWYKTDDLLAIHITNLEIFDKPKEISGFYKVGYREIVNTPNRIRNKNYLDEYLMAVKEYRLTRAPRSYMFIEI